MPWRAADRDLFAVEHQASIDRRWPVGIEDRDRQESVRLGRGVAASRPESEDLPLGPEFGDFPRSELMEDGVRIWWSDGVHGNPGDGAGIHVLGGLVIKESPLVDEMTREGDKPGKKGIELCRVYYQRMIENWLTHERGFNLKNLVLLLLFSEYNSNNAEDKGFIAPNRGYVGLWIKVRPSKYMRTLPLSLV